jgi:hypothetical protein
MPMPLRIWVVSATTAAFSVDFLWHGMDARDPWSIVAGLVCLAVAAGALFWLYWIHKKPGK